MAGGNKYNAFAGVFTPSILTILGVIMYMRLGWVVGEAGLIGTIGIILLAHVISVTTGLSISSIATDKKIKTGGIYYILSRSLGLPMGGAIGISLFIGTALSISLYLVGFSESFLAVDSIREFMGLSADINGFRIVGSIVILILVALAFISTSLAMKIQFFILIAISLSLISIVLGFFQNNIGIAIDLPLKSNGEFPLEYVFAIFFPAVTGFTAGVAMSGDLKDPKSAIPKGTILAIIAGFLVYTLLAIGIAIFIPRQDLLNNYNILSKIAWLPPLVIAGIWGATLSSALGGILGGPRILQAISKDKMTPKIFAKGYGETNEPRNALLLIFAIAECGILIGKLDVIAEVVSMFYLASYGFINLSYVLEKWASTDFRPTFRIHIGFGIVGFVASFAIMFKLGVVSMLTALLIMALLYFILKRRELQSESGDVWQSVWVSIIRRSLAKMENHSMEERNWQPNIILFSGAIDKRPHLLSFGKALIGKYGLLSNFDLHENQTHKLLFHKSQQAIKKEFIDESGVFTRQHSCNSIYEGIGMISQTYGFSGIEPNTVLMGWARQTKDPIRFVQMLNTLSSLDLNILLMDYSLTKGFGNKKQIDIWWRDSGNHGNLALTLTKFLSASVDWNNAQIRLLIVNSDNNQMQFIQKRAEEYLENIRIDAELRIINNEIEQKSFYDIMKAESQNSDLVLLGIPDIEHGKEEEFVKNTSNLIHKIGSVVLVKASSVFKSLHLGLSNSTLPPSPLEEINTIDAIAKKEYEITWPQNAALANDLKLLHKGICENYETNIIYINTFISKENSILLDEIEQSYFNTLQNIKDRYSKFETSKQIQLVNYQHNLFLLKMNQLIEQYFKIKLPEEKQILDSHWQIFNKNIQELFASTPKKLRIQYTKQDLQKDKDDTFKQKHFKFWKRIKPGETKKYNLHFKTLATKNILQETPLFWLEYYKNFGGLQFQFILKLLQLAKAIDNSFITLHNKISKTEVTKETFKTTDSQVKNILNDLKELNITNVQKLNENFKLYQTQKITSLSQIFNQVDANRFLPKNYKKPKATKQLKEQLLEIPDLWQRNQYLVSNAIVTEIKLLSLKLKVKTIISKLSHQLKEKINTEVTEICHSYVEKIDKIIGDEYLEDIDISKINANISTLYEETNKSLNRSVTNFPDTIEIYKEEAINKFNETQFNGMDYFKVSSKKLADFLLKNKLEAPLAEQLKMLTEILHEKISKFNDAKRLVSISKIDNDEFIESDDLDKPEEFLKEAKHNMQEALMGVENQLSTVLSELDALNVDMEQELNYYAFIKTASNLKHYMHNYERHSKSSKIRSYIDKAKYYVRKQQVNLIYTKSKAIGWRKQIEQKQDIANPVKLLLDLNFQLTPDKNIMEALPFFYKQLFVGQQMLHKDFWIARDNELSEARMAIDRYYQGYKGAIAVVSDPGMGKTFFSKQMASLYQISNPIQVQAPLQAEPNILDLKKAFQKADNGSKRSIENILKRLPDNSWIIIDDLELWWQQSELEQAPLKMIFDLISKYSDRLLFIVLSNKSVFKDILNIDNYLDLFVDVINLEPISAENIKDIILSRHKSSGLDLKLNARVSKNLNDAKWAMYFDKIHKITNGNIEGTLHFWLASVKNVEDKIINIQLPNITLENLEVLDIDSRIILKQVAKYRYVELLSLSKQLLMKPEILEKKLKYLIRSGLLEKNKDQYQQNKYTQHFVNYFLTKKGMI